MWSGFGRVDYGVGEADLWPWTMRICGRGRASEAGPVVGLRMVSTMRICGRGRGVRSCSGGWVKGGVDDVDLRPWMGRQKLLR